MLPKSLQISCIEWSQWAGIEPANPSVGLFTLEFPLYLASFDDQNKPLVYCWPVLVQCSITEGFTEDIRASFASAFDCETEFIRNA
jgi:hypothetical protein